MKNDIAQSLYLSLQQFSDISEIRPGVYQYEDCSNGVHYHMNRNHSSLTQDRLVALSKHALHSYFGIDPNEEHLYAYVENNLTDEFATEIEILFSVIQSGLCEVLGNHPYEEEYA